MLFIKAGKRGASPKCASKRNLREKRSPRNSDLRVRGNEIFFRPPDVWAAFAFLSSLRPARTKRGP
jgi:hypothetical protein